MRKGTCKFYNGDHHNKTCDAGVEYRSVTTRPDDIDGVAFRKPCVDWGKVKTSPMSAGQAKQWNQRGTCPKFQEPTDQEVKDYEAEMDAYCQRMEKVWKLVGELKQQHKNQSWASVVTCPACGGKLHVRLIAFDGMEGPQQHAHGRCETKDCANWME